MGREAKYAQVQDALREYIRNHCAVGSRIPSTVTLEQQFGVSAGTINRAIRDLVNEGKLERFKGRGTFVARNNKDIGFLWPNRVANWGHTPYPMEVLHAVEQETRAQNRHLLVRAVGEEMSPEFSGRDSNKVGGVLILFNSDHHVIEAYHRRQMPVVLVDPLLRTSGIPFVTSDHFSAAREAVLHLAGLGHRQIVHVTVHAELDSVPAAERIHGYHAAMREAGLEEWRCVHRTASSHAFTPPVEWEEGRTDPEAERLVAMIRERGATACFCYDDLVAFWVIRTCHDCGIRIPDDLSVVGINDTAMAGHMWPPLTTVHVSTDGVGRRAVQMLSTLIDEHRLTGSGEVVPVRLTERASTKALPAMKEGASPAVAV